MKGREGNRWDEPSAKEEERERGWRRKVENTRWKKGGGAKTGRKRVMKGRRKVEGREEKVEEGRGRDKVEGIEERKGKR